MIKLYKCVSIEFSINIDKEGNKINDGCKFEYQPKITDKKIDKEKEYDINSILGGEREVLRVSFGQFIIQ